MTRKPSLRHALYGDQSLARQKTLVPEPSDQSGLASETPLVGGLYRRHPTREIPTTRAKLWVVIAAVAVAALTIGLVVF